MRGILDEWYSERLFPEINASDIAGDLYISRYQPVILYLMST